ncbi:dihydrolipoamide acetyltransferase family protein [Rhodoflexus caldus]|uniref:dihydrolipoamide acetyltransferase family protein n=1 Tax=Rhodoflexus caldus TaxID=2891236 RepID=UPI00202AA5B8|nr:dihydrolipoamide acetyltransferase family protein [Rhodoflexus caldus]
MALIEMVMPKMGESVMEGTILNWLKKPGDRIAQDEAVLEVATDKVDTEIPSTHAGILKEILAEVGQVVQIGKPIALIETEEDAPNAPVSQPAQTTAAPTQTAAPAVTAVASSQVEEVAAPSGRFYSPLVLNMARAENISMQELDRIPGTGKDGRVTKNDMLAYLEQRKQQPAVAAAPVAQPVKEQEKPVTTPQERPLEQVKPATSVSGNVEIIEMDRMRKMIAQRMVDSKRISPHVTSFVEADVTNIVNWRNAHVRAFKEREGQTLTYTPIFLWAVAKALRDFPMINSSIDGDNIIVKKDINIGMAVALPSGNLIVPVIKNADQLNLRGMAYRVNDLAKRARENKLTPDDLSGGTYTVSNIGSFGNMLGTPIIMQPQVAILSVGAIVKKPAVIETEQGDFIGIRHMMFLSHSYDHRIIDGALGGMFVRRVADYLEKFDVKTEL